MANCDYFEELIASEPERELSAEEEAALRAHIAACESCRRFRDALSFATDELRAQAEPPEELFGNIMDEIGKIQPKKKKTARIISLKGLSLAAVAAVAILAGVHVIPRTAESGAAGVSRKGGTGAAAEPYEAAEEEEMLLLLPTEDKSASVNGGVGGSGSRGPEVFAAPVPNGVDPATEQYLLDEVFTGNEKRPIPAWPVDETYSFPDGEEYFLWHDGAEILWQRAGEETARVSPVQNTEFLRKMAEIG